MADALATPMTLGSFLDWEERQALRYEFDGIGPVAMTGGTYAHAMIQANLIRALGNRLDGNPCRAIGSELKVKTANGVRYPDAFVICAPLPLGSTVAESPVVVFEILSPGTANDDLGVKKAEYQAIASVRRYVVLQQTHRSAQVFHRVAATDGDASAWGFEFVFGRDAAIALTEIGVSLPLADVYQNIFPEEAAAS